jgi:hypothetical protein
MDTPPQFMKLATSLSLGRWGLKPERWPSASMEMTQLVQRRSRKVRICHWSINRNLFGRS